MDALTVLRREHTRIGQLFVEFDALSIRACKGRRAIAREIDELVRRHIEVEEALIYQHLDEPAHEHHIVLRLLDEIAATECHQEMYVARVHALRDMLLQHIAEEERCVFPAFAGTHAA